MKNNQGTETKPLRDRVKNLIVAISAGMYEREEIISVSLLAALCGQNTFLFGPPGTAKSLISRRIAYAFQKPAYFEYLMNRFSTPEEVFGPVSIKALKEDKYTRKTDSYLPKADFAFLDEIWKSSPAILNTLLTLINERLFKNGETIEPVPLKALIAASNETPDVNQGLEALYDRFIVRLMVQPISQLKYFEQLLKSKPCSAEASISEELSIKPEEWSTWLERLHSVNLSTETLTIIHLIRDKLAHQNASLKVYVSDRRWQRAAILMRAAAFFNGRSETNHGDALLLQHCLWTHEENYQEVMEIVADAVKEAGIDSGVNLDEIDAKKESLDHEINKELYHSSDIYKTEKIGNKQFFKMETNFRSQYSSSNRTKPLFIPAVKIKSRDTFHAVDESGNEQQYVECVFDGQGTCKVTSSSYGRESVNFKPEILFHKGDKKEDVNERLVSALSHSITEIKTDLISILEKVTKRFSEIEAELASPFVPLEKTNLVISGISDQIDNLKLRVKDCERLEELCR